MSMSMYMHICWVGVGGYTSVRLKLVGKAMINAPRRVAHTSQNMSYTHPYDDSCVKVLYILNTKDKHCDSNGHSVYYITILIANV